MPTKGKQKLGRQRRRLNYHKRYLGFSDDDGANSDNFLRSCLVDGELSHGGATTCSPGENRDSDGFYANEFFVILDKARQYYSHDILDEFVESCHVRQFSAFKEECKKVDCAYTQFSSSDNICFMQCYLNSDTQVPKVKVSVNINRNFEASVSVHDKRLSTEHMLWEEVPRTCTSIVEVDKLLRAVSKYTICAGNLDEDLQTLVPVGTFLDTTTAKYQGYRDGYLNSTIRSTHCKLLVYGDDKCGCCKTYRKTLLTLLRRKKNKPVTVRTPKKNWISSKVSNNRLSESQRFHKLKQMRSLATGLEKENSKLKTKLNGLITKQGVVLSHDDSEDILNIMKSTNSEIEGTYPDANSYQRLFWQEQMKYKNMKDKHGMRWHPMVVKWCIFLKSKSSNTYDALRNSGFIQLPSERTLYDYTNLVQKGVGFQPDIVAMLHKELQKDGVQPHHKIVGLLHDEIRIKSDLVYDKHTGDLIGFVDMGKVNNDLIHIDECLKNIDKPLAKYVLVLMVRGMSTNLKFPLAHFATNGVTSDQLFPILWTGVQLLEIDLGLTVLFITSDGASPNRRFTRMHGEPGNKGLIYRANNIFSPDERYIYFFSDPPHLIKTARNCLSNSYSHKKSRRMWKDGKDLSWLHIVDLYKEHCSDIYRRCSKLTKAHIDITSFGCMKVSYAAQVLSSTVADALELLYGPSTAETVEFIRHMNRFFDCLNVRSRKEGHVNRKADVLPFTSPDDPRLDYLLNDFLGYFDDWRKSVDNRRGDFSKAQRSAMQISYQTLEGLEMTVRSVVECVRYCLSSGMDFVLTNRFNQDPIEQQFGMHRTAGGCNTNPTLETFNSSMVRLRTVGSQALAPIRGNTKRNAKLATIDDTPLQKRNRKSTQ